MSARLLIAALLLGLIAVSPACAAPIRQPIHGNGEVIASIKPLHSMVAAIMGETGTPDLLVGGMQSPHGYQLKPSQVTALQKAAIVFYIAPDLETFLAKPLAALPKKTIQVSMMNTPGLKTLTPRAGGLWEADADAPAGNGGKDPHIWLDPDNVRLMAGYIVQQLSVLHPEYRSEYIHNMTIFMEKITKLDAELKKELGPVKGSQYIVFHDAFHYFEDAYGLHAAGSITLEPEQEPGAKRIAEITGRIRAAPVACVFSEPEFNSRLVKTVIGDTGVRTGAIDESGAAIPPGPDLYFTLMRQNADSFVKCLTPLKNDGSR